MFLFIFCHFTIGQQPSQWPFVTLSLLLLLLLVYEIRSSIWSPGTTKLLLISTTNFYHQSLNRVSTTKQILFFISVLANCLLLSTTFKYTNSSIIIWAAASKRRTTIQCKDVCSAFNYSWDEDESILSLRWLYSFSLVLLLWRCPLNDIYLN